MQPEKLTAINPHGARMDRCTRGERPEFTASDAACALAGTDREVMALVMYRYCNDQTVLHTLRYRAWLVAVDTVIRDGWKPPKGSEIVRKMSQAALFETVERRALDKEIAESIGVRPSAYARTWKPRYQSIKQAVGGWCARMDDQIRWSVKEW